MSAARSPGAAPRERAETGGDDLDVVSGALYTRIDCPHCNECYEVEGDATGDIAECDLCHGRVRVSHVN